MLDYNKQNILFFLLSIIIAFDISSNFLLDNNRFIIPLIRDFIFILLFFTIYKYANIISIIKNNLIFLIIFPIIGILYGYVYIYYFIRILIIFSVLRFTYIKNIEFFKKSILLIIIFLFIVHFFWAEYLLVNQGNRFFSANASVVSLAAIYLTLSSGNFYKIFGCLSGLLTGSLSYFMFFLIYIIRRPLIFILITFILYLTLPFIDSSESYRRTSTFLLSISDLEFNIFESTTFGIRLNQFYDVVNSGSFSLLIGAPVDISPGDAGIESQALYFIAYGGFLGTLLVLYFILIIFIRSTYFKKNLFLFLMILGLYSLTYRWFESFFSVYCFVLIFLELCSGINLYRNSNKHHLL